MNLVLFAHPAFLPSHSMARFAASIEEAARARGHNVTVRRPQPRAHALARGTRLAKWGGYFDQYVTFPRHIRVALRSDPSDTFYVFCDQALGPWVPLVAHRPHVVHCHDLLALRSALGEIPENPTSFTGRVYQRYIRSGFRSGKHFIAVSQHSRAELARVGGVPMNACHVVYNGLTYDYRRVPPQEALAVLAAAGLPHAPVGMLLHVGASQWYKNTVGVVRLYAAYCRTTANPLPLWMVSPAPSGEVQRELAELPASARVHFLSGLSDDTLRAAYSHASGFLFPSLAEGFGWPIAEALACGCPVLTTGEAPMTEVGGAVAHYLPKFQHGASLDDWASEGARKLVDVLGAPAAETEARRQLGMSWVRRFDARGAFDAYFAHYERILRMQLGRQGAVPTSSLGDDRAA